MSEAGVYFDPVNAPLTLSELAESGIGAAVEAMIGGARSWKASAA